jgi:hypothetical protein
MVAQEERNVLLASIIESPETVIWIHILKRGNCKVYLSGDSLGDLAAIVQPTDLPSEPTGFGSDASALWGLLTAVRDWQCVLVDTVCASPLGIIITDQLRTPVRYLDDIYHVPIKQVCPFDNKSVRWLTPGDLTLLEVAPPEVQPIGFWGDVRTSLTKGFCVI